MILTKKQIEIFIGWLALMGLMNWAIQGSLLAALIASCAGGVVALFGIWLMEVYLVNH